MTSAPKRAALSTPKKGGAWHGRFLEAFRQTGNVRLSAQGAGVDRTTVYRAAKADAEFAAAWREAEQDAIDTLEAVARQRALQTSDTLLIFLLKSLRPDRYRERIEMRVDMRREAERLAASLDGVSADDLIAEAEAIARGRS